jgi:hypothetical protein
MSNLRSVIERMKNETADKFDWIDRTLNQRDPEGDYMPGAL